MRIKKMLIAQRCVLIWVDLFYRLAKLTAVKGNEIAICDNMCIGIVKYRACFFQWMVDI